MSVLAKRTITVAVLVMMLMAAVAVTALAGDRRSAITVDVAEDPSQFVFNGDHVLEEPPELAGFPAYGDFFVTQGFIYPEGTLDESDPGVTCDVDEEGAPTDCEPAYEPIGEWTCYGVHIGEGAATQEGAWVVTTQVFELEREGSTRTIVTDGFEGPEVGVPVIRAITGGTDRFARARGEHEQVSLGLHPELFNVRSQNTLRWNS